jgi:hypothetical protein
MAYVVARPKGRFEIRESVHTAKGPRSRSLANFGRLTDEVLATARDRASRPFDADAVRASARKAGSPMAPARAARRARRPRPQHVPPAVPTGRPASREARDRFVESSRRMAASLETRPAISPEIRRDPGAALIGLLDLADQVPPFVARSDRPAEPLEFPPLARLVEARRQQDGRNKEHEQDGRKTQQKQEREE